MSQPDIDDKPDLVTVAEQKQPTSTVDAVLAGEVHRFTAEERAAAVALAAREDPGPNLFSWR